MLTRKQHELLCFIQERLDQSGISPSFEEMKEALALKSKSGVHRLVSALEERGFIRRLPNRARALEILKFADGSARLAEASHNGSAPETVGAIAARGHAQADNVTNIDKARKAKLPASISDRADVLNIPLHGRIAAGAPIEAFEGHEILPVPAALLGSGEHYALEISGDSMIEAGILDGDFALVQRADSARDGEIVVALVRNEEATLKYLRRENGMIRLDPANASHESQFYQPHEVQIQGKLAGLLRRYH